MHKRTANINYNIGMNLFNDKITDRTMDIII